MSEINNVVIQGAGALGALYASKFHDSGQFSVALIASGSSYERIKTNGFLVNGKHYHIPVIHPDDTPTCADLIIVALKHHHLLSAVQDLHNIVDENTIIMAIGDNRSSHNLEENPRASFIVVEPGANPAQWGGARLYLEVEAFERFGELLDSFRVQIRKAAGDTSASS